MSIAPTALCGSRLIGWLTANPTRRRPSPRRTDPAAAFIHRLTEKHDISETEFLVGGFDYTTALSQLGLSGHLDYADRNHIERWFQIFKQRTDRFYTSWTGSRRAVREWCQQFKQRVIEYASHALRSDFDCFMSRLSRGSPYSRLYFVKKARNVLVENHCMTDSFKRYYSHHRPHQALDNQTLLEALN